MSRPWRSWRPRENQNAECGMRNAECRCNRHAASDLSLQFRTPHSACRIRGGAVKYWVSIGGQTIEVDVDGNRVTIGGVRLDTDLAPVSGTPLYHLLLGGESWSVAAEPLEGVGRWALGMVGERVEVAVQDERTRGIEAVSGTGQHAAGGGTVRAAMPGLVGRIEGGGGQQVDAWARLV